MGKSGRLYVPLDVNWYDEWGHAVSPGAALLWVIAITACKRMQGDGQIARSQLRRLAPTGTTDEQFEEWLRELHLCDIAPIIAPIAPDDSPILLLGWTDWNGTPGQIKDASQSGGYGNHKRWHVNTGKPSDTCTFCLLDKVDSPPESPRTSPRIAPDNRPESLVEKSREEKNSNSSTSVPFEDDFEQVWLVYPRKDAKKAAQKAYIAQRRKGTSKQTLANATANFAKAMVAEERQKEHILMGSTFFGPNDRWEDFVKAAPEPAKPVVASGAGNLAFDDYADTMGEQVFLPGEDGYQP